MSEIELVKICIFTSSAIPVHYVSRIHELKSMDVLALVCLVEARRCEIPFINL